MRILLSAFLLLLALPSYAAESATDTGAVEKALNTLVRNGQIKGFELSKSAIPQLYEAVIDKTEIIYISSDGRYIFNGGDLLDLKNNAKNLTEERRNQIRLGQMEDLDEKEMIVFKPEGETKYDLTVFTDVDCFYCAKLHREVGQLTKAGVKVRYAAFPRAGVGSDTYNIMVSVWCSKDQQKALTEAKLKQPVKTATCNNPVKKQYELGQRLGISGTPALLLPNGKLFPGYVPAQRLVSLLRQES